MGGYASITNAQTATDTAVGTSASATAGTKNKLMFRGGHGGPGHHGVIGTVSAVNGSTITVTGPDGKTFTVNAGTATVQKMTTGALADIVVGDRIGVQGELSGTTVTAKTIMDDIPEPPARPANATWQAPVTTQVVQ